MRNRFLLFLVLPLLLAFSGCQHSAPQDDFTSGRYSGNLYQIDGDKLLLTGEFGDGHFLVGEDTKFSCYLPDNSDEPSYPGDIPMDISAEDLKPPMFLDVSYTPESGASTLKAAEIVIHPYVVSSIMVDGALYRALGYYVDEGDYEFSVDTAQAAGTIQSAAPFGLPPEEDGQVTFDLTGLVGTEYYRSTGPYTGQDDPMESVSIPVDQENGAWMVFQLYSD